MNDGTPIFWRGPGGALVCDQAILGVTQSLERHTAEYYTGWNLVGETITDSAARRIAEALGGRFIEHSLFNRLP